MLELVFKELLTWYLANSERISRIDKDIVNVMYLDFQRF